jgi:hypothetical protein
MKGLFKATLVIVGLIASNYMFQTSKDIPDFGQALERSYFQAVAIYTYYFIAGREGSFFG